MSQPPDVLDLGMLPAEDRPPRHGYRGERDAPSVEGAPTGLSIALSREAGARGGTIARLVAAKLGWQVYDQELLEYMSQDGVARESLLDGLPPVCADWVASRLEVLRAHSDIDRDAGVLNLARLILGLAAQGEVVLIGRGAGCILPRVSTLNVRVVAPLADRIAYMSQWLRLTTGEATERVRSRDERRGDFVSAHFHRPPGDVHQYDLVLNSSLLGEETCADLIVYAARAREYTLRDFPTATDR